jgi:hypothetical protein
MFFGFVNVTMALTDRNIKQDQLMGLSPLISI